MRSPKRAATCAFPKIMGRRSSLTHLTLLRKRTQLALKHNPTIVSQEGQTIIPSIPRPMPPTNVLPLPDHSRIMRTTSKQILKGGKV